MSELRHKYFRNQRYKQALLTKYYNGRNTYYPSSIIFITKEPATNIQPITYFGYTDTEFCRSKNHNRYEYWSRPDVQYTIIEKKVNRNLKWARKYLNRQIRHNCNGKKYKEPRNAEYRKLYELWWWVE